MENLNKEIKSKLDKKAYRCSEDFRRKWNMPNEPITDIYSLVRSKEFLMLRFPNNYMISGIYMEKKDRNNIMHRCMYINTADPYGRQNFTIAHELYHAFYEKNKEGICIADRLTKDSVEFTAERFASYLLIPRNTLIEVLMERESKTIQFNELLNMQKLFKVSFQALIYAINDLDKYGQHKNCVPLNIKNYAKYYNSKYWRELETKTKLFDSSDKLNLSLREYEFPEKFKDNLIRNFKNGRIEKDKVEDLFDFFGYKLEI